LSPLKRARPEGFEVVDEVLREEVIQPVEGPPVHEMTMKRQQLVDLQSVLGAERHAWSMTTN